MGTGNASRLGTLAWLVPCSSRLSGGRLYLRFMPSMRPWPQIATFPREGTTMRLLVVEDRQVMADSIARSLRREGLAVDVAYDGATALDMAAVNTYQVVVLDRDLPRVHGDDVCRRLAGGDTKILMLTAAGTVDERVDGLTIGADDYLGKPFALSELLAADPGPRAPVGAGPAPRCWPLVTSALTRINDSAARREVVGIDQQGVRCARGAARRGRRRGQHRRISWSRCGMPTSIPLPIPLE